jgi:hypothetical protein
MGADACAARPNRVAADICSQKRRRMACTKDTPTALYTATQPRFGTTPPFSALTKRFLLLFFKKEGLFSLLG